MGGSSKSVTVGYRYRMGQHLVLCQRAHAILRVHQGEKAAWAGSVTSNGTFTIDAPKLHGGDKKEGGMQGPVDALFGGATQAPNAYLAGLLGSVPAFRGVVSLVLRRVLIATNNPYPKPIAVDAAYWPAQAWYPAKAVISGVDANPAHALYELATEELGYPVARIDDAAWRAAADTLYAEDLGLSLLSDDDAEALAAEIRRHIDATWYEDRSTGLLRLKLIRPDYDPEALLELGPGQIVELESFARTGLGDLVTQLTLGYVDGETDQDAAITAHDIAALGLQGREVARTVSYPGISRGAVAARVAARDLAVLSRPLARCTLTAQRVAWALAPGDVFRLAWPALGIVALPMRVGRIDYGTLTEGRVRIEAVEDVFGAATAIYAPPPSTAWVDPVVDPQPCPYRALIEAPYWVVVRDVVGEFPSVLGDLDPTSGLLLAMGVRPGYGTYDAELRTRVGSAAYTERDTESCCPSAVLASAIGPADTTLTVTDGVDLDRVAVDTWALLGPELVKVKSTPAGTLTVARGVLDTVPQSHAAGARLWFGDGNYLLDPTEYAASVSVQAKLLPRTARGQLDEASAPADSLTIAGRWSKPYPPGKLLINGSSYPASISGGSITVAWAHRDRTQQTAYLVEQGEGNIGPEGGVTYRLDLYDQVGTLISSTSGITGTSRTQALGVGVTAVRVVLRAERSGVASWQSHDYTVARSP